MAIFEIYANNDPVQTRIVRDKGSFVALVLPAVWLAWHRLWFALAAYLLIAFFFMAIGSTSWAVVAGIFSFFPGLYLFLEGPRLLAARHLRQGFQLVDVIEADSLESAETKWFAKPFSRINQRAANLETISQPVSRPVIDRPDFGLFAEE